MSSDDWRIVYALDVHCPSGIGGHTYSRRRKGDSRALRIAVARLRLRLGDRTLQGEERQRASMVRVKEMEAVIK